MMKKVILALSIILLTCLFLNMFKIISLGSYKPILYIMGGVIIILIYMEGKKKK
ncbi:hypothetical protein KAOT1_03277 [Kordia algicida OT-1]|uniref:Uncharacterized protein n=1 Tax=Kordia algicida OT-1 TaxID=391587 RepID=A9DVB3_9FLAO|nr:hypothetical protein KAOT1_03277 [Kordia algicida OT-1]